MTKFFSPRGHTLLDTLFALFIVALLCGVATSSMQAQQTQVRLQASAEALHSALLTASTQALRLEKRVSLCAAAPQQVAVGDGQTLRCHLVSDGSFASAWRQGWLMFEDDNNNAVWDAGEVRLQQQAPLPASVSVSGNATVSHFVSFGASGRSLSPNGAFQAGTLTICEHQALTGKGWLLVINAVGRPRLESAEIVTCA